MTSDMWPYCLDLRGFPIVTCFLRAVSGEEILIWRSYVVLPQGEAGFDYFGTAWLAGWSHVAHDKWKKVGASALFFGNVRELCFYIGVGPGWEAWGHKPYRERFPS